MRILAAAAHDFVRSCMRSGYGVDMTDLQALLSKPPASFAWSVSADGQRTIGVALGAVIDIWEDHIELAVLVPPDDAALAARGGALLLLVLCALRPDWVTAPDWLKVQMGIAARAKGYYEGQHFGRRVMFSFDRAQSRAMLRLHQ